MFDMIIYNIYFGF